MPRFDSKIFNGEVFGQYIQTIPSTTRTELAKSGAVGSNEQARTALANQVGSLYAKVPYFGLISPDTSQNNDGATDITSSNTTTYEQGFVTASRMDGWTERSFSINITSGVDFMAHVASQIAQYKEQVKQKMLLKMLEGIFSMPVSGNGVPNKFNKKFISAHTLDLTGESGDAAKVGASTLNSAMQKACGDNKGTFSLVIMHSVVATNLENQNLMERLKYTDSHGIQRDLALGTWNGRLVLIDDTMPVTEVAPTFAVTSDASAVAGKTYYTSAGVETAFASGVYEMTAEGYTSYTSYVLGTGAIILDEIPDSVPYEMYRDPKTNGGQDTLYVRDRFICGAFGISFEKPTTITASATNADLATGTNWALINDGTTCIDHKAIPIARIISKG